MVWPLDCLHLDQPMDIIDDIDIKAYHVVKTSNKCYSLASAAYLNLEDLELHETFSYHVLFF